MTDHDMTPFEHRLTARLSAYAEISVAPVDDAPTQGANTGLTLNEGAQAAITAAKLHFNDVDNTDAQAAGAFKTGQYALGNLLYTPAPNVMMGGELQWGRRENFSDGFQSDGFKVQFSFKYNFSWKLGG